MGRWIFDLWQNTQNTQTVFPAIFIKFQNLLLSSIFNIFVEFELRKLIHALYFYAEVIMISQLLYDFMFVRPKEPHKAKTHLWARASQKLAPESKSGHTKKLLSPNLHLLFVFNYALLICRQKKLHIFIFELVFLKIWIFWKNAKKCLLKIEGNYFSIFKTCPRPRAQSSIITGIWQ